MKSRKDKVAVPGLRGRLSRRLFEQVASFYPYLLGLYLLTLLVSDLSVVWRHSFNWPAMEIMIALFSLAALIGRRDPKASLKPALSAKTLLASIFVVVALVAHIDPHSFLILLFGIGTVIYRRIDPKFALALGALLLAAAPILSAVGKERLAIPVTVSAFYFFVILVFASMAESVEKVTPSPG